MEPGQSSQGQAAGLTSEQSSGAVRRRRELRRVRAAWGWWGDEALEGLISDPLETSLIDRPITEQGPIN